MVCLLFLRVGQQIPEKCFYAHTSGMGFLCMGLDSLNNQIYQSYQQYGGRPSVLPIGALGPEVAHKNIVEQYTTSAANLGAQQALAHKAEKVVAHKNNRPVAEPPGKNYSKVFGLGTEQVRADRFSWQDVRKTASQNISGFGQDLKAGNISPRSYFQETVVQRNVQPVKSLFSGGQVTGQGMINSFGGALVGYDLFRNTRDTYKDASARENGAGGSRADTIKESATAFGKYAVRDGVTWEAAGVGNAIGKALMPVTFRGVPIGGVLFGALGGVTAQKGMNRVLKTGDHDPVQQRKALAKSEKKAENQATKEDKIAEGKEKDRMLDDGRVPPV